MAWHNYICQLPQELQMHLTGSHGPLHLQVPWMFSNLIFFYSRQFFILPVPAFAFHNFGGVAGTLASENRSKKVVEYTSASSMSWVTTSPISFWRGPTFFLCGSCVTPKCLSMCSFCTAT